MPRREVIQGTGGYHSTQPWSNVRSGSATLYGENGALAFAQRHGITIPRNVRFVADASLPADMPAIYGMFTNQRASHTFDELVNARGAILVRVRPEVLHSDEAILAVIGHEMHELSSLKKLFADNGGRLTHERLANLIQAPQGIVHQDAVRYGDELVRNRRNSRGGRS